MVPKPPQACSRPLEKTTPNPPHFDAPFPNPHACTHPPYVPISACPNCTCKRFKSAVFYSIAIRPCAGTEADPSPASRQESQPEPSPGTGSPPERLSAQPVGHPDDEIRNRPDCKTPIPPSGLPAAVREARSGQPPAAAGLRNRKLRRRARNG